MTDVGLIDLVGSALSTKIRDVSVLLAGNELPWIGTRRQISAAVNETSGDLRILLSHSPDQLPWARKQGFDLMLAGHTHGGQICLPMVGPLVAPSRFGVKYASGLFFESPTVLHVSRGVSAQHPIRINCPQEITKLVLRCAHHSSR